MTLARSAVLRNLSVSSGWLLGGCVRAVPAAKFPEYGIGFLGVALAFGLTVVIEQPVCGREF